MAASSAGHSSLVVPRSTSEFHAMVENARRHHRAMGGQLVDIAAALKNALPAVIAARGGTHRGMLGLDAKFAASKVVKPLIDAAAAEDEIARDLIVTWQRYNQYVVNIKPDGAQGFKVDG